MTYEFRLPELGENIVSAGIAAVLVKEGQTISAQDSVLEVETDKATLEVPCPVGGTVTKVHVQAGGKAAVGQVILSVEESSAAAKPSPAAPAAVPDPTPAPQAVVAAPAVKAAGGKQEFKLPFLGESITSVKVASVLVKAGDTIAKDSPLLEVETDKATVEVPSSVAGTVLDVAIVAGDMVSEGSLILTYSGTEAVAVSSAQHAEKRAGSAVAVSAPVAKAATAVVSKPNGAGRVAASPVSGKSVAASPTVRRLAREIGVEISTVRGTGPRGRISHDDVKAHSRALLKRVQPAPVSSGFVAGTVGIPVQPLPDFSKFGAVTKEPINNIRKKTAEQMARAWSTIPMVTQFDKADVTNLEKMRLQMDAKAKKSGNRITVTAILLRIVASALKKFPKFNASLDLVREEVVYKNYFNVGVAVDTERGLLVPVVKGVDSKNVFELSADLAVVAEKARTRKVSPDDLSGSCFTITNLGGIGGTGFTPIVNPPEVGILGVSRSSMEPVWTDGAFVPRQILPLSLSYDHRLIDGADAARFLRFICEALENPAVLVFEG